MQIPKDPAILLSYTNTQLRDYYTSLDDLCLSLDIDKINLIKSLLKIDYVYDETQNRFI